MAEVNSGTLYSWAQADYQNESVLDEEAWTLALANMSAWFSHDLDEKYYMLLNKEFSDYTIFHLGGMNYSEGFNNLKEIIESRGEPLHVDYNKNHSYFEVWVRHNQDDYPHMYVLFPCTDFIVEM